MLPNAHLQYFFGKEAVMMNYSDGNMEGIVAPTDSRWRKDLQNFEKGLVDEAETCKNEIEEEQRRKRKLVEDGKAPAFKPNFFVEQPHPYVTKEFLEKEENPICYKLIEGEKGYWQRRINKDWKDMPNLWGPF